MFAGPVGAKWALWTCLSPSEEALFWAAVSLALPSLFTSAGKLPEELRSSWNWLGWSLFYTCAHAHRYICSHICTYMHPCNTVKSMQRCAQVHKQHSAWRSYVCKCIIISWKNTQSCSVLNRQFLQYSLYVKVQSYHAVLQHIGMDWKWNNEADFNFHADQMKSVRLIQHILRPKQLKRSQNHRYHHSQNRKTNRLVIVLSPFDKSLGLREHCIHSS